MALLRADFFLSKHPEVKACLLQSRNAPVIDSSSTDQVFCLRDGKGDNKAGQSWQDVRHVLQAAQDDNQKWEHSVEQADLELRKWLPECFR